MLLISVCFQVTGLQTQNGSGHASPNVAILAKLREEMHLLAERKKSFTPLGKLSLNSQKADFQDQASNGVTCVASSVASKAQNELNNRINL